MDGMQRWGVQHPDTKGVRSWITEGSLRSHDQLIPVINEFVTNIQFRQRNRLAKADWVFDPDGLAAMGVKFGLPEPPTQEQRAAKSVENQAQYEQHCKYANEEHNRMAQYERESEITRRKKKVVERICALFFPFDGIDIDGETLSPEYLAMQQRRRQLRTSITNFVGFSVDEGEDDDEILKGVTMLKEIRFAGFGGDWLSAPLDPLDSGKRMFFTKPAEIVAYYGSDEAQKLLDADFKFCTQLMMDGRWSVSVVAKTEDDLARESEIDAEGERK